MDRFYYEMKYLKRERDVNKQKLWKMIIEWQNIDYTTTELIRTFNRIYLKKNKTYLDRKHLNNIKKLLVSNIFELRKFFNQWTAILRNNNLFTNNIRNHKGEFDKYYDEINRTFKLKQIRDNISFHFFAWKIPTNEYIESYSLVDKIPIEKLNELWMRARKVGEILKRKMIR